VLGKWLCSILILFIPSYGYVDYLTVDQAKRVFHSQENIKLNGRILFIDYAVNKFPHKLKSM